MKFLSMIAQDRWYDPNRVVGYSEEELVKIEKLYDIKISGFLREFMLEAGRGDGGLIGDDPIILYRNNWSVRGHFRTQDGFREELLKLLFKNNPAEFKLFCNSTLLFSIEAETQYYYLNTTGANPERVFHYDENEDIIEDTNVDFIDYMKNTVRVYGGFSPQIICQGEMLIIK